MSSKSTFDAYVNAYIKTNGANSITGAQMNNALIALLSDKINWTDTTGGGGITYQYSRIADDNTAPLAGEFSFNAAKTKIYFHQENSGGDNMNNVFNLMADGNIGLRDNTDNEQLLFNVSSYSLSSNVYTFTGTTLVTSLGSVLGGHTVGFDIANNTDTSATPAARYSATRLTDGSTTIGTGEFAFNAGKTTIKISDTLIDDETDLFDLMKNGIITVVKDQNPTSQFRFKVDSFSVSSSTYTFTGSLLVNAGDTSTGSYTLNFYPSDLPELPNKFVYTKKTNGTTVLSNSEFSFNSAISTGDNTMYFSEYYLTDLEPIPMLEYMIQYGGVILGQYNNPANNDLEEDEFFVATVTGGEATAPVSDIDLNVTVLYQNMSSNTDNEEIVLTFIPSTNKKILSGTQIRVETASSITTTPSNREVSFNNVDVDSATTVSINVGTSIYNAIWTDITATSRILMTQANQNGASLGSYAVIKLAGTPSWVSNTFTATIEDGNVQTNITDFTADTNEYIIEYFNS